MRFEPLGSTEHDQLQLDAAKTLGPEGTMLELRKTEKRMGVRRMIVGVSKQTGLKSLTDATWDNVSGQDLDNNWDKYFNAKDDAVLLGLYSEYHELTNEDLDSVVKNVQSVSIES